MDLAVEAGFIAVQQMQHPRLAGEVAEGLRHRVSLVEGDGLAVIDGDIEDFGFDTADSHTPPVGRDEVIDQHAGDGVGGLEKVMELGGELVEVLLGLLFEDDVFGEEAVFERVPGRFGFAFGRDGAFGFGSVGAGGGLACRTGGVRFAALARDVRPFGARGVLTRGVCFALLARGVPGFASRGWMRLRRVWI